MIDHTVTQVCALFISSSSSCLIRTLSSLSDLSICLTFPLFITFSFLHFLLLFTFLFLDVVDYNHAHYDWGAGSPDKYELLHRLWVQRSLHHRGLYRYHPRVRDRATVPWRLRLRRYHHRSDALQRVSKTSRSLWKRKHVRPVCRHRQWVMIERWNPLFVVTSVTSNVTKFRDKTLKANRLGLSWTDKGSKSSLTVRRRLETRIPGWIWPKKYTKN